MGAEDDEKARLARRGLALIDAVAPEEVKARVRERAKGAAKDAVLSGLEAIAELTGGSPGEGASRGSAGAGAAMDGSAALQALEQGHAESFDARLRAASAAAAQKQGQRAALRARLAEARKAFPEESKQFAVLIFSCVDLLDDLEDHAEGRQDLSPAELQRREQLLAKVGALMTPNAGAALASFVDHVVRTSRMVRGA